MLGFSRQGKFAPHRVVLAAAIATASLASASAFGQVTADAAKKEGESRETPILTPTDAQAAPAPVIGDKIAITAGFDATSHFISFGADVWGGGNDNPLPFANDSTYFAYGTATLKFTDELSGFINLWSDNNNNTDSSIGGDVQEIDLNVGVNYAWDKFTFGLAHNYWIYAGEEEKAVEVSVGYNDMDVLAEGFALNPAILAHYRYDGFGGQEEAAVIQASIRPTFTVAKDTAYPITLAVPAAVAFFVDHYQGGDSGFGYANVGLSASVPLAFIPEGYGAWSAGASAILWYTPEDSIPNNPDEVFVVTSLSLNVAF